MNSRDLAALRRVLDRARNSEMQEIADLDVCANALHEWERKAKVSPANRKGRGRPVDSGPKLQRDVKRVAWYLYYSEQTNKRPSREGEPLSLGRKKYTRAKAVELAIAKGIDSLGSTISTATFLDHIKKYGKRGRRVEGADGKSRWVGRGPAWFVLQDWVEAENVLPWDWSDGGKPSAEEEFKDLPTPVKGYKLG
jgi:hypothetical protein